MPELGAIKRGSTLRAIAVPLAPATMQPAVVDQPLVASLSPLALRLQPEVAAEPVAGRPKRLVATRLDTMLLRPDLVAISGLFQQGDQGKPREQLTVPVCPVADPVDTVLYEAPADPATRSYVPRYRVRRSGNRELISLSERDDHWELVIELEAFAAPELGDVGAAGPIAHGLGVLLRYRVGDGQFEKAFEVTDTPEGNKRATLKLADTTERNVVYQALTDDGYATKLVIRRAITVAVATGVTTAGTSTTPTGTIPDAPVQFAAQLAPNLMMARRPVLDDFPQFPDPPVIIDPLPRPTDPLPPPPPPPPPPVPLFRELAATLDHDERSSFVLPRALYDYVFSGIEDGTGAITFRLYHVEYGGRQHRYYRDPLDPRVFHYLPDAFKLGRQATAPHAPTLLLRFLPGTQGIEDVTAQLDYVAVPYTDPERLRAAAAALPALLDDDPLPAGQIPAFQVLSPPRDQLKLLLSVPGSASDVRDRAQVELSSVVRERLALPLTDFQSIWASLFSATPVLLQGSIEVTLADGVEHVPFVGRMDDLAGSVLDTAERVLADGTVEVTITNGGESPVTGTGVRAQVLAAAGAVDCAVAPTDALQLAPGAAVTLQLTPSAPTADVTDAVVTFATLKVAPDRDALYEAILDRSGPLDFVRLITVRGKHLFDVAPADDALIAVLVEFERGNTAELTPAAADGQGMTRLPLRDYVLGRMDSADVANAVYRYRVRLIHQRSGQLRSDDWIEDSTEILYPSTPVAPAPVPAAPGT